MAWSSGMGLLIFSDDLTRDGGVNGCKSPHPNPI